MQIPCTQGIKVFTRENKDCYCRTTSVTHASWIKKKRLHLYMLVLMYDLYKCSELDKHSADYDHSSRALSLT